MLRACSNESADLLLGQRWLIEVETADDDGTIVDDVTPTITVTLPGGAPATPTAERVSAGRWRAAYPTTLGGRHVAVVSATGLGALGFAAWVDEVVAVMPDLIAARDYLGETSASDEEIAGALAAEASAQRDACRIPAAYPASLREALLRRVARNLAMRGLPVAVLQGDADGGSTILPGRDPEVRRFERQHPKLAFG